MQQISLHDDATGSTARVLVDFGFNCFSFRPQIEGQAHEVLWSAPNFAGGGEKPSHSGIPILFPYPGRLRGHSLNYGGKTYVLDGDDTRGNAIHGYVLNRAWEVVEQSATGVTGRFQASRVDAALLEKWPSDFTVTATYQLDGAALQLSLEVANPGSTPLPFGLGLHPYFRVPLGPNGQAADCTVTVPVTHYWELENMLPTGRRLPTDATRSLAAGMPFGQTKLDDVFTGVEHQEGWATATIDDAPNTRRLNVAFDEPFRECVVYNPPHREAICIEPYTCVPDTYWLGDRGVEAGLRVLGPGEKFAARMTVWLEATGA